MIERATSILPKDKPLVITSRLLNASRDLVWTVLTSPDHIKHFWGPDGFTNTIKSMDVRVDGEWRFTMHGPDGTVYPNRIIYRALDAPRFMRWEHDNGGEGPVDHKFIGEIELFEEGTKTRIELRMTEKSIAARDAVAVYAVPGGIQNLERLATYIAPLADEKLLFVIERSFPVSQQRLFEACTKPEHMVQWFAPKGMKTIKAEQDLRPGGTYHYGLSSGQGQEMWGIITYREITPHTRLVYAQSFSDQDRNITTHPMAPTWPQEMVTVFEFISEGAKQTRLKISWTYAGTDDAEAATFVAAHDGMRGGWTGSLDGLTEYLATHL
jgi:uncharacterized protein YndB with AHSA1/START domain